MCVVCALCVSVLWHSRTSALSHLADTALPTPARSHTGSHLPTAPCVPRCTTSAFCVVPTAWCSAPHCTVCALLHCCCGQGAVGSVTHCQAAWGLWAMEIVLRAAALPEGSGEWYSRRSLPPSLGAVGRASPAIHCRPAWGSGQWYSCDTLRHGLGAVGSGPPATHCLTAWGQWAVGLLQCAAPLPGGRGQWISCNALPHCLGAVGR